MSVRFVFAWYDLWVGGYWDRLNRRLYLLPLPMVGVVFDFGRRLPETVACGCAECRARETGETNG